MPFMDFNNDTSFPNNLSLVPLAKIVTDNLCGVRAFIERDELHFEASYKIFRREEGSSRCLVIPDCLLPSWLGLHTSPIPISHVLQSLLCSPVPLFLCSSVLLFLRFYVSLFACAPLFHIIYVPSSLPFHVLCFPFPAFRCLFP